MARKTIKAAELFDPVEVDLWGTMFRLREPTRSLEAKMEVKQSELGAAHEQTKDEQDEDEARKVMMPLFYDMLDLLLEPSDHGEKKTHAKTVVKRKYEGDEIGLSHIFALVEKLGEAATERPT